VAAFPWFGWQTSLEYADGINLRFVLDDEHGFFLYFGQKKAPHVHVRPVGLINFIYYVFFFE